MPDKVFLDTNVLIYAHDADAGRRHHTARRIVEELWESRLGVVSTQVLQEFYVNVTRKIPTPLPKSTAREVVVAYAAWEVERIAVPHVVQASELEERYQLSFWDALIVVAAQGAGAAKLLSEDLPAGRRFGGVRVENPFA
jgi:predicted nucleic acid-binding protein